MNWLISANGKMYDHASSFAHHGSIDWRQGNINYAVGDIVYIYCTSPIQKVRYKCRITKLNKDRYETRDDKEYWIDIKEYEKSREGKYFNLELIEEVDSDQLSLDQLRKNGLNSIPQGPMRLSAELEKYISDAFVSGNDEFFPDIIDPVVEEGCRKQVYVNKYERSSLARSKCIEIYGYKCQVCAFDFENIYGEVGKEFIHVHHLIPIHTIGKSYKIDYTKDLIPVCPNCHAMLHRKNKADGSCYSVEELRALIKKPLN